MQEGKEQEATAETEKGVGGHFRVIRLFRGSRLGLRPDSGCRPDSGV